jgi:hypothetical protein
MPAIQKVSILANEPALRRLRYAFWKAASLSAFSSGLPLCAATDAGLAQFFLTSEIADGNSRTVSGV